MHEPDPDLGWRSKEGRYVFGTSPIRHHILARSHARDRPAPVRADAAVVVLGCSFVEGWALSDEETFAWKLQERFARVLGVLIGALIVVVVGGGILFSTGMLGNQHSSGVKIEMPKITTGAK